MKKIFFKIYIIPLVMILNLTASANQETNQETKPIQIESESESKSKYKNTELKSKVNVETKSKMDLDRSIEKAKAAKQVYEEGSEALKLTNALKTLNDISKLNISKKAKMILANKRLGEVEKKELRQAKEFLEKLNLILEAN